MLVIKKLSPQDINVTYTCSYGFDQDEKMLSEDMVFHDHAVHKSSNDSGDGSTTRIGLVLGIVITGVCLIVAGVLFAMYKTGHLKKAMQCFHRQGYRNTVELAEIQVATIDSIGMDGQVTTNQNENDQLLFDHEGNDSENLSTDIRDLQHSYSQTDHTCTASTSQESVYSRHSSCSVNNGSMSCSECNLDDEANSSTLEYNSMNDKLANEGQQDNCSSSQTTSQNDIAYSTDNSATSRPDKTFQFSHLNSQNRLGFDKPNGFRGEYQKEETRKHSFTNWMLSYPSIDQMVEAGFFYLAYETRAKCFYCGYSKIWCEGDDPLDKSLHKDCLYLEQRSKMPNDDPDETVPMSPV